MRIASLPGAGTAAVVGFVCLNTGSSVSFRSTLRIGIILDNMRPPADQRIPDLQVMGLQVASKS
jgi:hypothetical protein